MVETVVVYWHWWALAILLLILEMVLPGMFFLWLAAAALIPGVVVLAFRDIGLGIQLTVFAVTAVGSILLARKLFAGQGIASDQPLLNRRAEGYVGRKFTLEQDMVDGEGRVRVGDSVWKVRGEDLPAGTKVAVKGVDGTILLVEEVRNGRDAETEI